MTATTEPGKDLPSWFKETFEVPGPAQALLEQYSGFAPDEIVPHVAELVSDL